MASTEEKQALLPVTQADRDAFAALDICGGWWRNMKADKIAEFAREGMIDSNPLIQAFARHRISHSLPGDVGIAGGGRV